MLDIFIALFGGAYYGSKILSDRSANKAYKNNISEWSNARNAWLSSVTDETYEKELLDKQTNDYDEWIRFLKEETAEFYDCLFSKYSFEDIHPRRLWKSRYKDVAEQLVRRNSSYAECIILAKRGKIPRFGGPLTTWFRQKEKCDESIVGAKLNSALEVYIAKWCAEEVKRHGIDAEFVVENFDINGTNNSYWVI